MVHIGAVWKLKVPSSVFVASPRLLVKGVKVNVGKSRFPNKIRLKEVENEISHR